MEYVRIACQVVIALGIFNVWILRYSKPTAWRGGQATSMKEEFETYGLPGWLMQVVGFLKVSFAILLVVGIWYPVVVNPAAVGMAILMMGAIAMHIKVKDPLRKALPAFTMLVLSLLVILL
ncbi:DoxX family protein [Pontibacter sp. CAU 1760]